MHFKSSMSAVSLIFLLVALTMSNTACSQTISASASTLDPRMGLTTIPLWDGAPSATNTEDTGLTVFYPQAGKSNGAAVVIAPGGGYTALAMNIEGRQVADWFAVRGFTAFVLKYRLGPAHPYPEPLRDGQRAIRLVRSMSSQLNVQPNKIGMVGFSAGGHLAAMVATSSDDGNASAGDNVERQSDRPDFVVLGYPWINAMQPNSQGFITYCSKMKSLSEQQCKSLETPYTPTLHVSGRTPPTFIFSTTDDKVVPISASLDYYTALLRAGASAELHIFRHGPHGSGLGSGDPALDAWPGLLENWLRMQSLL